MKWDKISTKDVLDLYLSERPRTWDKKEKEVILLAGKQKRTPDSVALKTSNFVFLDPIAESQGRAGMSQVSKLDKDVWLESSGSGLSLRANVSPAESNHISPEIMTDLWARFNKRVLGFSDFANPGDAFIKSETGYKNAILKRFQEKLGGGRMANLIAEGKGIEALKLIEKCLVNPPSNFISFYGWKQAFGDQNESIICEVLAEYLQATVGSYAGPKSLDGLFAVSAKHGLKPRWDSLSSLLWALRPTDYFPVKISYYRKLAEEISFDLPSGAPTNESFYRVMEFGKTFWKALEPQKPSTWVDVQSFIWCVCPGTYGPDVEKLGAPFNEIFSSFENAQWSFDLIQTTLLELGVAEEEYTSDRRISLTLTKEANGKIKLRLNFGNWAILTFLNRSAGDERIQFVCQENHLPSSVSEVKDGHTFADEINGRKYALVYCSAEQMRDEAGEERHSFAAALAGIADRFKSWKGGVYQSSHRPKVLQMVYDLPFRNDLLIKGLAGEIVAELDLPSPSQLLVDAGTAIDKTGLHCIPRLINCFFSAIAVKPILILTGNSGTGKTKLAELFAQWLCGEEKGRLALIPVGADWTDNRNVLGFVNHIRPTQPEGEAEGGVPVYQSTGILDLLLSARDEPEKPFFLILDEMNLSHVERYFADFLSAMESREGKLHLHREGRKLPRKPGGPADVPESLPMPRNVFVIGTVNVDETTYMFSPKVLDRANVIEFRVDPGAPKSFLESGGKPISEIIPAPAGYAEAFLELSKRARGLDGAIPLDLVADAKNPPEDAREGLQKCIDTITDLFALMQTSHQEFAFRSMSEILRFLAVDYELTPDDADWNWRAAIDAQILQKILPKLHGSKRKLGALLAALAAYCEKGVKADAEKTLESQSAVETYSAEGDKKYSGPLFKDSHRKLCEMILTVRRDQFVSFIQ